MFCIVDDTGKVIQVFDTSPTIDQSITVYEFPSIVVGDYIIDGNYAGQPSNEFDSWDGIQWVTDTVEQQASLDAQQSVINQQQAIQELASAGGCSRLIFKAYNSANSASFTTNNTACPFSVETYNPDNLVISGGVVSLPIIEDSAYLVRAEYSIDHVSGNSRSKGFGLFQQDKGSGFTDIDGTDALSYHRQATQGADSSSTSAIVEIGTETTCDVRLVARRISGSAQLRFVNQACRIEVWRVK